MKTTDEFMEAKKRPDVRGRAKLYKKKIQQAKTAEKKAIAAEKSGDDQNAAYYYGVAATNMDAAINWASNEQRERATARFAKLSGLQKKAEKKFHKDFGMDNPSWKDKPIRGTDGVLRHHRTNWAAIDKHLGRK